ncbi:MAG: cell wall-associated protease, partial [Solirubrobacteraceae bacterium]|nr:cell wall-associated protease [Solirubrobacteraceae bacterium]
APIRYADLNGDNVQELIVPLEDGKLHAFEPNGTELAGWPVATPTLAQAANHASALNAAGLEPPLEPLRGPAIVDLDGDGRPEVVDAAGTHLYVWESDGQLRPGFPVSIDPALCRGEDQSQPLHHRKCGFLASPTVGHLEGQANPIDIVASALDGHLYAFRPDGTTVAGYPVNLVDPGMPANQQMLAESINNPAVGDLNGDGYDDVVIASNESYDAGSPGPEDLNGGFAEVFAQGLGSAAGGTSRVYAIDGKTAKFRSGWPIKLPGAIQSTLPLVGPGHDAALAKLNGSQAIVVSTTGGALSVFDVDGHLVRSMQQNEYGPTSDATQQDSPQLNLFENASIGDLLGAGQPSIVKYGVNVSQAANLLLVGQNVPYEHYIGAYDPTTGQPLPSFPRVTDDYQFLSSSNIGKVASGPTNQVLAGTGLGLLHAYDGASGQDVSGFPKVTGGWLFAPATLSDDHRIADITREGYLFEWNAPNAPSCQSEWPSFRHDPHQTGNYDADGTPPAAALGATLQDLGDGHYRLKFKSPGDDGFCGTAQTYETDVNGHPGDAGAGKPVAGGSQYDRNIVPPKGTTSITLRARDEARNLGAPVTVQIPGGHPAIGPPTPCLDRARPTLRFPHGGLRGTRRRLSLSGLASDQGCSGSTADHTFSVPGHVHRVDFATALLVRGGCKFIDARGHFGRKRSCRLHPAFQRVRGTTHPRLTLRGRFPRGTYAVRVRVYDAVGNIGRPSPRRFSVR